MAPKRIISAVTSKTQYVNLTNSGANISTSGPHERQCSDYYLGLDEVLEMTDLVNPNAASLRSAGFEFLMNTNRYKKDGYIGILYNMLEFPAKVIFSANKVRSAGHFYDDKQLKLGGGKLLVTTDYGESCMFISDGIADLPFICPNNEEM